MHRLGIGLFVLVATVGAAGCSSSSGTGAGNRDGGTAANGNTGGRSNGNANQAGAAPTGPNPNASDAGGGTGGNGVQLVPPDAGLLAGCQTLCSALDSAGCPNQQSLTNCVLGCDLAVGLPACGDAYNSLFSCAATSTASCNASGSAELTDCVVEEAATVTCLVSSAQADPALTQSCNNYCAASAAANCGGAVGAADAGADGGAGGAATSLEDCGLVCSLAGVALPACATLWDSYLSCAEQATFTCDANGNATASGCQLMQLLFFACASNALPMMPAN